MKLSKDTMVVLDNFSKINPNLYFTKGNNLSTLSIEETLLGYAVIQEDIPADFGIYDLTEFLSAMSLFKEPDLEFKADHIRISEGNQVIRYFGAEPEILTKPTINSDNIPTVIKNITDFSINFGLTSDNINMILKTSSVLKCQDVLVRGNGKIISVIVGDKKNSSANKYEFPVGDTKSSFEAYFKINNLRLIPGDYNVSINENKVSKFVNTADQTKLIYFVGLESDSDFE